MNKTKIEWTDYTWSPVTGCLHGCPYCYARRIAERFHPKNAVGDDCTQPGDGLHEIRYKRTRGFRYGFAPTLHSHRLGEPQRRRKPSRIFVSSMGDLFGGWVPSEWIEAVLRTVRECPQHTFIFLTKNPKGYQGHDYPPNAWIGVTCEDQQAANERIPLLLATPAAVRFVSVEPILGPVDLCNVRFDHWTSMDVLDGWGYTSRGVVGQSLPNCYVNPVDWVIVGAQTGPAAVVPDRKWARDIIEACDSAEVSLFLKDNLNWPERIQEWPKGGASA